ncbi:hypothetical protein BGY98DRAFT_950076, partial [Russula aff. rugulosa BPL654]
KLKGNKRAKLRSAGSSTGGHGHGPVLGGADYVDIMMGSRRRAREEALKLPRDTDVVCDPIGTSGLSSISSLAPSPAAHATTVKHNLGG